MLLFHNSKFKFNFKSGPSLDQNSATYSTNHYYPHAIQHLLKTCKVREDKQLVPHHFVTSIFHCCAIRLLISITIYFSFILQYSIINPSCSFYTNTGLQTINAKQNTNQNKTQSMFANNQTNSTCKLVFWQNQRTHFPILLQYQL